MDATIAEDTPVAVYSFTGVEVIEHREEPGAGDLGQADLFDYEEQSGIFTFSTYASEWLFKASVVTLTLEPQK